MTKTQKLCVIGLNPETLEVVSMCAFSFKQGIHEIVDEGLLMFAIPLPEENWMYRVPPEEWLKSVGLVK